ncbi:MAG: squalene--hopene cyclase, partial [Anaerolineae bacterium]|nr:squalene--hopene cyclase [Anaerolineae bacterium]
MEVEKSIAYVQGRGNAVERARLGSILWGEPPPEEALQALAARQGPDGGFAYWTPQV